MPRDQIAGQNYDIKTSRESFERLEQFKYLGTTLTNKNSIHEEISSECLLSFGADLLSSSLLSKNIKIKIHRIVNLPVVLCETWSVT
jgi:hypothetical protein